MWLSGCFRLYGNHLPQIKCAIHYNTQQLPPCSVIIYSWSDITELVVDFLILSIVTSCVPGWMHTSTDLLNVDAPNFCHLACEYQVQNRSHHAIEQSCTVIIKTITFSWENEIKWCQWGRIGISMPDWWDVYDIHFLSCGHCNWLLKCSLINILTQLWGFWHW